MLQQHRYEKYDTVNNISYNILFISVCFELRRLLLGLLTNLCNHITLLFDLILPQISTQHDPTRMNSYHKPHKARTQNSCNVLGLSQLWIHNRTLSADF